MHNKAKNQTQPAKDCAKGGLWTHRWEYKSRALYPLLALFFAD
jgi:hypothetical protein